MKYPHDKFKNPLPMVGGMQHPYDKLKTHYLWASNMQYIPHYNLKSTLSLGNQNSTSICQTWNILGAN
jgi:hypothetical protein